MFINCEIIGELEFKVISPASGHATVCSRGQAAVSWPSPAYD